jgi:hypothetical protein
MLDNVPFSFYRRFMMISGAPLTVDIPSDPAFKDRFWYWRGASGKKYIHSVYAVDDCPPLPGAIYLAVRRQGNLRTVMALGRFMPFWDNVVTGRSLNRLCASGVNEIHVHLLAKSPDQCEAIVTDLEGALELQNHDHFAEEQSVALAA